MLMSKASLTRQTCQRTVSEEGCFLQIDNPDSRDWGLPRGLSHFDRQQRTTDKIWGKGHVRGKRIEGGSHPRLLLRELTPGRLRELGDSSFESPVTNCRN